MQTGLDLIRDIDTCRVPAGQCALWWLGQHSFIVKLGETVVYLDVFLSPHKGRQVEPLLTPAQCTNADLILGTHDHIDHIDRPSWPGMAQAAPQALFVVPELLRERVARELSLPAGRVAGLDLGRTLTHKEVTITAIPAAHEFLNRDEATGLYPYLGYIVEGNGFRLYHAGDCCIYEGQQALLRGKPFDLFFLPINGRDARKLENHLIGNMTFQEAADLAGSLRPRAVIPSHYEMFAKNSANVQDFVDYVRIKYPRQQVVVPTHGTRVLL
jgi:L-ascorbate metabolism protein UlaG (beta-lactamase superfamily)